MHKFKERLHRRRKIQRKDAHSPSTWPSGEQLTPLHPVPAHGSRPDQFRLTPKAPSIAIKACPVSSQTTHPEF
jgi:hypothetical protein